MISVLSYNDLTWTRPGLLTNFDMDKRSQLHTYIRPLAEVTNSPSGPDEIRPLVPYLLVVVNIVRRVSYQVRQESVRPILPSIKNWFRNRGWMDTSLVRLYKANHQLAGRYESLFAIKAHSIRAFLLANATQARLKPRRSLSVLSHCPSWSLRVSQRLNTERAP